MTEKASRSYVADLLDGRQSLLIVGTNEQAAEASSKVREELVRLGHVEPDGVELHNRTTAGRGDLIQLRDNNSDTRDRHGHPLVNREIYQVVGHKRGGDLIVRRRLGIDDLGNQRYAEELRLPASYVNEHVELAYASTVHSALGQTVDTAHPIIDPQMSRENVYVALTRGRYLNVGHVITEVLATDGQEPEQSNRFAVLGANLERDGVEQSATEVRREELEAAESLARLGPIWSDLVAKEYEARYRERLRDVAGEELATAVSSDDAAGALWRRLRAAELAGNDVDDVIRHAVERRELDSADSVAEVLAWRVERRLGDTEATEPATYAERTPVSDDAVGNYTRQLAEAMDRRVTELGERAVNEQPQWAERLGPVPEDPLERMAWSERAGKVAAYREAYGYHREDDPIGPAPGQGNVEARAAWHTAYSALEAPEDERLIAARVDGELRNLIGNYEREEAWAPAYVDDELHEANLAARDYRTQLVFERAESAAAQDRTADEQAQAAQRLADFEALSRRLDKRASDLDEIAQARSAWYAETVSARELADQARKELARRGADITAKQQVRDEQPGVDRTERTEPTPVVPEEREFSPERREDRQIASREAERKRVEEPAREEPTETRVAGQEPAEAARAERAEPVPVAQEAPQLSPEQREDQSAPRHEAEHIEEAAHQELTETRVQAELQRAREATDILADQQAERHRVDVEAEAERSREYARRLGDDLDYEVDYQHEADDHHVADVSRSQVDE
jgi:hypothetical protein